MKLVNQWGLMVGVAAVLGGCAASGSKMAGHNDGHDGHGKTAMKMDDSSGHGDGHGGDHDKAESPVGRPVKGMAATKTYQVSMLDSMEFKFAPPPALKKGDVVKFVVTNKGLINHEFSIGSAAEQKAHGEMMKKMPGMVHEDGSTITVKPGQTKELLWQFAGNEVMFACNVPGHFEAGMMHKASIQ